MNKSENRAKKATLAISKSRQELNDTFTNQELIEILQKNDCPYPARVVPILSRKGIIVKEGTLYHFKSEEPVYFRSIEKELETISIGHSRANQKRKIQPKSNIFKSFGRFLSKIFR